jgi:opacity protein-like surface antigen
MKKYLMIAVAAVALSLGSLATSGEASAKGFKGGFHGGHHGHRWHGHRWYGSYGYYNYSPCYWVHRPWGPVKVCPSYY